MLEQKLAMAVINPKVTASDLLLLLRQSIDGGDSWCVDYACCQLMMKCSLLTSEIEWEALQAEIEAAFPGQPAILKMATLGWFFLEETTQLRNASRWACSQWLIEHEPKNRCHEHPYVYDVDDEYFVEGSKAWLQSVMSLSDDVTVLRHASRFFFRRDPDQCEELLAIGAALDAGEPWWQ